MPTNDFSIAVPSGPETSTWWHPSTGSCPESRQTLTAITFDGWRSQVPSRLPVALLSFIDMFRLLGVIFLVMIPLVFVMRKLHQGPSPVVVSAE